MEGSASSEKDGFCSMGNDSTQGTWWLTIQLSPLIYQPRLSSCISSPWCPPSASAQGVCLQVGKCVQEPLKRYLGFQPPSGSPGRMESLLILTARCYGGSCSWPWFSALSQDPTLQLRYTSQFSTATFGCGASPFCISALPTCPSVAAFLCP